MLRQRQRSLELLPADRADADEEHAVASVAPSSSCDPGARFGAVDDLEERLRDVRVLCDHCVSIINESLETLREESL